MRGPGQQQASGVPLPPSCSGPGTVPLMHVHPASHPEGTTGQAAAEGLDSPSTPGPWGGSGPAAGLAGLGDACSPEILFPAPGALTGHRHHAVARCVSTQHARGLCSSPGDSGKTDVAQAGPLCQSLVEETRSVEDWGQDRGGSREPSRRWVHRAASRARAVVCRDGQHGRSLPLRPHSGRATVSDRRAHRGGAGGGRCRPGPRVEASSGWRRQAARAGQDRAAGRPEHGHTGPLPAQGSASPRTGYPSPQEARPPCAP